MKKFLFLIFIFFQIIEANNTIIINNQKQLYEKFNIKYLKTDKKNSNFTEILKKNFDKEISNAFALSYVKGDLWFKFELINKSKTENFIITLNEHFYEIANLYYMKNNKWLKKSSSVFDRIENREVKIKDNSFKIKLKENEKQVFYLQLNAQFSYFGKLLIYEEKKFIQYSYKKKVILFFIFSIVFSATCISFLLFFYLKEKIYFYYFGYTFFTFLYLFVVNGFLIYLNLANYMYKIHATSSILMVFFIFFSFEFLNIKRYMKKSYTYLKYVPIGLILLIIPQVFHSFRPWTSYINMYISFTMILLIILALKTYYKNYNSKFYIIIFIVYFLSILIIMLMVYGIFEYNFFTRYSGTIGIIFENITFLFYLLIKYNSVQKNNIKFKDELIKIKNKNQENLEEEIKSRTFELYIHKEHLKKLLLEKEFLIKEVHHRVKNNFNLVIGLLHLESVKNSNIHNDFFIHIINRIKSMSNIHYYLCNEKSSSVINIKTYLEDILSDFLTIEDKQKADLRYRIENINIFIKDAVNLGIILNELLTNSIKHNKKEKYLLLKIILEKKGKNLIFIVCDSGIGFNLNQKKEGLGLELIRKKASSLKDSKFNFKFNQGTQFELIFKNREDF